MAVNTVSVMLALCFFLTSCATGHYYYDIDRNGTRYYETMKGEKIKVTVDGEIYGEDGRKLGVATEKQRGWESFLDSAVTIKTPDPFYLSHSPLEMVSASADKAFVETLRRRIPVTR